MARSAATEGRAGPDGCDVLVFDAAHLRALIIGSAEVGEILMRAYILRRTAWIADGGDVIHLAVGFAKQRVLIAGPRPVAGAECGGPGFVYAGAAAGA